jgi:ABC-2 type transport system permease protein
MNAQPEVLTPAAESPTQPFYWSVRRELWEHRSVYIAPLGAAALGLFAFLFNLVHLPNSIRSLSAMDPEAQHIELAMPYSHLAFLLVLAALIVGIVYSLDALYGERRDRSILFWKSLPVSDLTTVLAKAFIPLVVLPLLAFAITVILQLIMLLLSAAVLLLNGGGAATLWTQLPLFQLQLVLLYWLVVLTLWYAPIYGWLMLVSGWARRTAFLWAVLPPLALCILEKLTLNTTYFGGLLKDRIIGFGLRGFTFTTPDGAYIDPHYVLLRQLTPGRFLSSPGLWLGLLFAAACFAAAVRLRRYREPI